MTASQLAKQHGFNLKKVEELTGLSRQTLINWHRDRPELFKIIILGCKANQPD